MDKRIIEGKIATLRTAEGQVKALIAELVIAVVDRVHGHDDVDTANLFLLALSPLNQGKVLGFFKEHVGHKVEEGILTKRLKPFIEKGVSIDPYKNASDKFDAFKESNMTFWQWAVAKKPKGSNKLTVEAVAAKAKKARDAVCEAMNENVIDKAQAFTMLLGDVMTMEDIMSILSAMTKTQEAVDKASKEPASA